MSSGQRPVVVRAFERAEPSIIDGLAEMGSATVHEAIGRRGFLGADIRPIQRGARMAGPAVTALCHPGDNLMIHAAVETCRPGDIMVVAVTAPCAHGAFGELLATSLQAHGVRGLVIDTGVRDTAELRSMGFAAWSRHVSCQGTVKATPGSVNVAVVMGGQSIRPGDIVCADDDGVVVVPRDEAAWALEMCRRRLDDEARTRARLAAGELGLDIYGLRRQLASAGVKWVDSLDEASG